MKKHRCDNCEREWTDEEVGDSFFPNIDDLGMRLEPGETVPSAECPDEECRALCYPIVPDKRQYADLSWHPDDVLSLNLSNNETGEDMTDEQAEEFLRSNQKYLRDRLCELGWEVLDTLLLMDDWTYKE